jgi:multidrug efflux pump subunit AcrA (membrane-fusion protein)
MTAVLWNSFLGLVALGVFGCGSKPAFQAPPLPTVIVAKPVIKEIVEWEYFTAQTQAVDTVTISPRVTGYIDSILFKEGDVVNSGVDACQSANSLHLSLASV